jgi:hypothetical protein
VIIARDGAVDAQQEPAMVVALGTQILVGAVRERLADLSSRAPWGRFLLNVINVVARPAASS